MEPPLYNGVRLIRSLAVLRSDRQHSIVYRPKFPGRELRSDRAQTARVEPQATAQAVP